jgi:putative ABC transport system substrate-binding protein
MNAGSPMRTASEQFLRSVAAQSGIELVVVEATGPDDYAPAFAAMRVGAAQGLLIQANPTFSADADRLASLARDNGLPTMCEWIEMARAGCLLGYGPDRQMLRRRLADFVARVFRGTPPGELPIEVPTTFTFAVNRRTAHALAVTLPPSMLVRADEVIE